MTIINLSEVTENENQHGRWLKDEQRYDDGCKENRPHAPYSRYAPTVEQIEQVIWDNHAADIAAQEIMKLIPPQQCAPTEEELAREVHAMLGYRFGVDEICAHGTFAGGPTHGEEYRMCRFIAKLVVALYAAQPTVEQAKAEGWDEGFKGAREAYGLHIAAPLDPRVSNPYRSEASHG